MLNKNYNDFNLSVSSIEYAVEKKTEKDWEYLCESRPFYGLLCVLDGMAEYLCDNIATTIKKGTIVYLEKNKRYKISTISGNIFHYIVISFNVENEPLIPIRTLPIIMNKVHIIEYFTRIVEVNAKKGTAHKLFECSIIQLILYDLLTEQIRDDEFSQELLPALEYIENHLQDSFAIDILSTLCHMNISMFRRKFKSFTGMSPLKYINLLRIEKAKEMLKSELYTQTEIAESCGFNTTSYFVKIFKSITGNSPGKY